MSEPLIVTSVAGAIGGSTAVLTAATGELLVEKTGVYNIALEGVMLVGALTGYLADRATDSWIIGLLVGGLAGALFALIFGLITVGLRTDMVVVGVALSSSRLGSPTRSAESTWARPARRRYPRGISRVCRRSHMSGRPCSSRRSSPISLFCSRLEHGGYSGGPATA